MAERQRKVKIGIKQKLIEEAGNKCANPGCVNWRTHLHHIKHWAVYKAHDSDHMIALCPTCHDETHHGRLSISDETLYTWKNISRPEASQIALITVEPSRELGLLTGSITLSTTVKEAFVFRLSNSSYLSLRIVDNDILQINAKFTDIDGQEIVRVVENYVRTKKDKRINFDFRPGRAFITVPVDYRFAPLWLIRQMQFQQPSYARDGRITVIDIETVKPGLLKVKGCWPSKNNGIVVTDNTLSFCDKRWIGPRSLVSQDKGAKLIFDFSGELSQETFAMFNIEHLANRA